jgi:hypothetical protein
MANLNRYLEAIIVSLNETIKVMEEIDKGEE